MKRQNKYRYLWIVQDWCGYGWEDRTVSEDFDKSLDSFKDYRDNTPGRAYRLIQRRELNKVSA